MDKKVYLTSNLKYLRKANKKTLYDIAKTMDKSYATIHYWETGQRDMYAMDLWNISHYYNVSMDDLVFKDLRNDNNTISSTLKSKINTLSEEQQKKVIDMIDIIK